MTTTLDTEKAIKGLSLEIALLRYELREGIELGVLVGLLHPVCIKIALVQEVLKLVRDGRYYDVPKDLQIHLMPFYKINPIRDYEKKPKP